MSEVYCKQILSTNSISGDYTDSTKLVKNVEKWKSVFYFARLSRHESFVNPDLGLWTSPIHGLSEYTIRISSPLLVLVGTLFYKKSKKRHFQNLSELELPKRKWGRGDTVGSNTPPTKVPIPPILGNWDPLVFV